MVVKPSFEVFGDGPIPAVACNEEGLQTGSCLARAMGPELTINGKTIALSAPSDVAVAQRVAAHIQRRIEEDDWRPYKSKAEAVTAWAKLGGIRVKVMDALGLM